MFSFGCENWHYGGDITFALVNWNTDEITSVLFSTVFPSQIGLTCTWKE